MTEPKKTYGSEYHFLRYRHEQPEKLDRAILKAVGAPRKSTIEWLYPSVDTRKEPQGVNFVDDRQVRDQWKKFWPTSGRQQSWDGVAKLLSPGRLRNRNARTYCAAPTKCGKHQFGMSFG